MLPKTQRIRIACTMLFATTLAAYGQVAAPSGGASCAALQQEQAACEQKLQDWPDLARYRQANAALPPPGKSDHRVVFLGDSITELWTRATKMFSPGSPYINRGISGQTTPQILIRFRPDVINLSPKVVVILAGTNDIAGNTGPSTPEMIEDNLASMVDLARAHKIRVVLASILPASKYPWSPGIQPAGEIQQINAWMRGYCHGRGCVYLDYYSSMVNAEHGMRGDLTVDGVHPNAKGYELMGALVEKAIAEALKK